MITSLDHILLLLSQLTDEELESLDEDKYAKALFTLYH
jgi:hypothetical protein